MAGLWPVDERCCAQCQQSDGDEDSGEVRRQRALVVRRRADRNQGEGHERERR
jgi:hypothetical protein